MTNRLYYSDEAKQTAMRRQAALAISSMILGAGIGAVTAVLLTPNDGEDMRRAVINALESGFSKGQEQANEALARLEAEYPEMSERIKTLLARVDERADESV